MLVEYCHGMEVDYCKPCGGLWFDGGEVQGLVKARELPENIAIVAGDRNPPPLPTGERTRYCPRCRVGMNKIAYRGISLDHCGHCAGTWFDPGELSLFLYEKKKANSAPVPKIPRRLEVKEIFSRLLEFFSREG